MLLWSGWPLNGQHRLWYYRAQQRLLLANPVLWLGYLCVRYSLVSGCSNWFHILLIILDFVWSFRKGSGLSCYCPGTKILWNQSHQQRSRQCGLFSPFMFVIYPLGVCLSPASPCHFSLSLALLSSLLVNKLCSLLARGVRDKWHS